MVSHNMKDENSGPVDNRSSTEISQDTDLLGHWRNTDSYSSDGFTMVTDTHFIFYGDGYFATYSRTEGSVGSSASPTEFGTWQTQNNTLHLRFASGYLDHHSYVAYPDRIYLPNNPLSLWERIG